jgi:hypothetical protein
LDDAEQRRHHGCPLLVIGAKLVGDAIAGLST